MISFRSHKAALLLFAVASIASETTSALAQLSDHEIAHHVQEIFIDFHDPDLRPETAATIRQLRAQSADTARIISEIIPTVTKEGDIINLLQFLASFDNPVPARNATRDLLESKRIKESGFLYALAVSDVLRRVGTTEDQKYFLELFKNFDPSDDISIYYNALKTLSAIGDESTHSALTNFLSSSSLAAIANADLRADFETRIRNTIRAVAERSGASTGSRQSLTASPEDVKSGSSPPGTQPPQSPPPPTKDNLIGKAPPKETPTPLAETPEAEKPNSLLFVLLGLLVIAIVIVVLRKARKE